MNSSPPTAALIRLASNSCAAIARSCAADRSRNSDPLAALPGYSSFKLVQKFESSYLGTAKAMSLYCATKVGGEVVIVLVVMGTDEKKDWIANANCGVAAGEEVIVVCSLVNFHT